MPSAVRDFEVLLDFTNDTQECVTIQPFSDYQRSTGAIVMLNPAESILLILSSGLVYRYAVKTNSDVAAVV